MSVLTLCIGFPTQTKTASATTLATESDALLLHIVEERDGFFDPYKKQLTDAMQALRPIVVNAPHRSPKHRKPYLELAKQHGYTTKAIYWNLALEEVVADSSLDEATLRKYQRQLQVPTYSEAIDVLEVKTSEPIDDVAAAFFQEHERALVANPTGLIRELERDGRLQAWLPELHRAIPIDQHNPHHRFTVYDHILKAAEVVGGSSLKFIWTLLLHDIGKAYPGIKQFTGRLLENYGAWRKKDFVLIENGADIRDGRDSGEHYVVKGQQIPKALISTDLHGHFYDHENLGAQMAFRVLTRFGYPHDFAVEVMTLIQFHMSLPYDADTAELRELRKFYDKVGRYAPDLLFVRLADSRGK